MKDLKFTQTATRLDDDPRNQGARYSIDVTFEVDETIAKPVVEIYCDGPMLRGLIKRPKDAFLSGQMSSTRGDMFRGSWTAPPLTVGTPMHAEIFAVTELHVVKVVADSFDNVQASRQGPVH